MRDLIRPLGSTHNSTQSGWLILFNPDHLPGSTNWGNRQTLPFRRTTSFSTDIYRLLFNSSSRYRHNEGSCLIYGPLASISLRPRDPSWIWIRYIQYATHRNNFTSPPKLAMSTAMPNLAPTPSDYFTSGQHFLETFTLLPETIKITNSRWLQSFSPQTANTTFATLMANISPSHVQRHAAFSTLS